MINLFNNLYDSDYKIKVEKFDINGIKFVKTKSTESVFL